MAFWIRMGAFFQGGIFYVFVFETNTSEQNTPLKKCIHAYCIQNAIPELGRRRAVLWRVVLILYATVRTEFRMKFPDIFRFNAFVLVLKRS